MPRKTGLLLDPIFADHDTGPGHPETAGRVLAIAEKLTAEKLTERTTPIEGRAATDDEILRCHTDGYLKTVVAEVDGASSGTLSTGDTVYGPHSLDVAREAAGGLIAATELVAKGKLDNAFCAVRPPGHHATPDTGMGFCLFNNAAVAARHAQAELGLERVAIIDWDVHHGNGTQDIFFDDGSVFYFSTHQHPWYPGTGAVHETGRGKGANTTLNAPLPAGSGMEEIEAAFRQAFLPKVREFKPDLIIISAGFDSRVGDPLGNFQLTDADFVHLTRILIELAGEFADGKLVSVLEGGYNQQGLAEAVAAHLAELIETPAAAE